MPKLSLPVRLALLVAGTTLPLIVFAAAIVLNNYEQDRRDASQRVVETVRSIRLVLDAEMQRMTGGIVLCLEGDRFIVLHLMIAGRLSWKPAGAEIGRAHV